MNKRTIRNALMSAAVAATTLTSIDEAMADGTNNAPSKFNGSVSFGVVNKNYLINGKQQGESPMLSEGINLNYGKFGLFHQLNTDPEQAREVDIGVSYSQNLGTVLGNTLSAKLSLEHKMFPPTQNSFDLIDLGFNVKTKLPVDFNLLLRYRFEGEMGGDGEIVRLGASTKPLKLGKVFGFDATAGLNGSVTYANHFGDKESYFSHGFVGGEVKLTKGQLGISGFVGEQIGFHDLLKDKVKGRETDTIFGIKATYKF